MGRRNGNARPQAEAAPVSLEQVAEIEEVLAVVPVPVGERHHGFRDAAKHAPSRVSSRMYAQVRTVVDALDEADLHVARVTLPPQYASEVTAQVASLRARLKDARELIPDAVRDRSKADDVKGELRYLVAVSALLDPAIVALVHQAKTERDAAGVELSEDQQARLDGARADARSVLDALAGGRTGQISSAVARLHETGLVPVTA